jgi:mannosyl-glycoprotein endo-beta-N-acetylglucosaminidase
MGPQPPEETPAPPPEPEPVFGVTTARNLNFRILPAANADIIRELPNGTSLEILEERSGWLRVRVLSDNQMGWVSAEFVNITDPNAEVTPTPARSGRVIASNGLRIRSGPSTNHDSLGGLLFGDIVTIVEEQSGWYRITAPQNGWVSAQFIRIT